MDCSTSAPSPPLDESDEPPTPLRSPSRLDFCMEDLGDDDAPTHEMDWSCTPFCDNCPYTFIEEDPFAVDIAPLASPRIPIVDGANDDPPQATDSPAHEDTDTFFAPPDPMDEVVFEPRAPIPVRPPSSEVEVDALESMPPSRIAPQRLNYPHHGFSRSALLQQKTLWNSRHEEWAEWQSRVEHGEAQKQDSETNDAYTGLATSQPRAVGSPPPYMRTPLSGLERDVAHHPPWNREQDVHSSIYPRVGDIAALRDPYSVNVDRSFFKLPLWTLHKTLYSFDMQQRSASLAPPASAYNAAHVHASLSSSTLSSYSSSTSGDDEESDSTLVADDSPVSKSQLPLEPFKSASSQDSPPSWDHFYGWELSWYARWELLIGLFQHDHTKYDAIDIPEKAAAPLQFTAAPSSPPRRIFHFTVGGDEDDEDEDEDEDYGTLVADATFSVDFDEECERAMAFYSRELKRSVRTL
ncbi:hypothetical protein OG21DRAFT_589057 [Imleria badia]|nr:hypothetical protein OG21DRAFT_589057 [Imleria badia]